MIGVPAGMVASMSTAVRSFSGDDIVNVNVFSSPSSSIEILSINFVASEALDARARFVKMKFAFSPVVPTIRMLPLKPSMTIARAPGIMPRSVEADCSTEPVTNVPSSVRPIS